MTNDINPIPHKAVGWVLMKAAAEERDVLLANNKRQEAEIAKLEAEIKSKQSSHFNSFKVGDTLRMPHYTTAGGFRVWTVEGVHLGGEKQEGTYHLRAIDIKDNEEIQVPCIMLETHPEIELI